MKRGLFVASTMGAALAGCARATNALNDNTSIHDILGVAETLNRTVIGTHGMAKEYRESDITRDFPTNGLATPTADPLYGRLVTAGFRGFVLPVTGLVDLPQSLTLAQLRVLATVSQITRHDCVEGWSVVGRWTGVPLGRVLGLVRPKPEARFVVFRSFDRDDEGTQFYGSLDLAQAAHPQTLLALDLNGAPIDPDHGGPVRLRVPLQLAYKSTKWVRQIEVVSDLGHIGSGKGGYWEDQGYDWYAGI